MKAFVHINYSFLYLQFIQYFQCKFGVILLYITCSCIIFFSINYYYSKSINNQLGERGTSIMCPINGANSQSVRHTGPTRSIARPCFTVTPPQWYSGGATFYVAKKWSWLARYAELEGEFSLVRVDRTYSDGFKTAK